MFVQVPSTCTVPIFLKGEGDYKACVLYRLAIFHANSRELKLHFADVLASVASNSADILKRMAERAVNPSNVDRFMQDAYEGAGGTCVNVAREEEVNEDAGGNREILRDTTLDDGRGSSVRMQEQAVFLNTPQAVQKFVDSACSALKREMQQEMQEKLQEMQEKQQQMQQDIRKTNKDICNYKGYVRSQQERMRMDFVNQNREVRDEVDEVKAAIDKTQAEIDKQDSKMQQAETQYNHMYKLYDLFMREKKGHETSIDQHDKSIEHLEDMVMKLDDRIQTQNTVWEAIQQAQKDQVQKDEMITDNINQFNGRMTEMFDLLKKQAPETEQAPGKEQAQGKEQAPENEQASGEEEESEEEQALGEGSALRVAIPFKKRKFDSVSMTVNVEVSGNTAAMTPEPRGEQKAADASVSQDAAATLASMQNVHDDHINMQRRAYLCPMDGHDVWVMDVRDEGPKLNSALFPPGMTMDDAAKILRDVCGKEIESIRVPNGTKKPWYRKGVRDCVLASPEVIEKLKQKEEQNKKRKHFFGKFF